MFWIAIASLLGTLYSLLPHGPILDVKKSSLDVMNIVGAPLTNKDTGHLGFALNVYYADKGDIAVTAMTHRAITVSASQLLSEDELEQYRKMGRLVAAPVPNVGQDIQPGLTPEHYFSTPEDDQHLEELRNAAQNVLAGKSRLYLFVTMKYLDSALLPKQVRVTEFCGWFLGTFDMWHNCGNRIYTASLPDAGV
jgi:hypothetical protein